MKEKIKCAKCGSSEINLVWDFTKQKKEEKLKNGKNNKKVWH